MINKLSFISLTNSGFYPLNLPFLNFKVSCYGFIEQVSSIPVKGFGQRIKRCDFIRIQPKADGLLIHNVDITLYYRIIQFIADPYK